MELPYESLNDVLQYNMKYPYQNHNFLYCVPLEADPDYIKESMTAV
jgi:hypothetical protein